MIQSQIGTVRFEAAGTVKDVNSTPSSTYFVLEVQEQNSLSEITCRVYSMSSVDKRLVVEGNSVYVEGVLEFAGHNTRVEVSNMLALGSSSYTQSYQKVEIIGCLLGDVELSSSKSDVKFARFTVGVSDGNIMNEIPCLASRGTAIAVSKALHPGYLVKIDGKVVFNKGESPYVNIKRFFVLGEDASLC